MSTWNELTGPESDVVISSRVRFARNIAGYPFTSIAGEDTLDEILVLIRKSIEDMRVPLGLMLADLKEKSIIEKHCLIERHLMSPEMLERKPPCGLILNSDESLSVMINEEDHLRIQAILPGLQMENCYKVCDDFEIKLGKKINYAYNEKLGYLTSCPTNLGTGLRVSAMMHLPALVESGMINKILEACGKMGVAVRGVYGENSDAEGNIFQISNQVTLGHSEEDIIASMIHIINQIIEKERNLRQRLLNRSKAAFEDKIHRAYGILTNARIISCNEAMELMSWVRLGIDMKIIDYINPVNMNILLVEVQPGTIQKNAGKEMQTPERDEIRAALCRSMLAKETV